MAGFNQELPNELIKQLGELQTGKMFEEMVSKSADVVLENVKSNMKKVFKDTTRLEKCLVKTKVYRTPSDGAVNDKVAFYGYFKNEQGKEVPADLVAKAREYGTTRGEAKKPFMRKSFKKSQITKVMEEVQARYIKDE